jgi:hypothetical protein
MNLGSITKVAKALAQKAGSRKLAVTAAATGATEVTWPMAAVAIAYIISQAVVDVADGR